MEVLSRSWELTLFPTKAPARCFQVISMTNLAGYWWCVQLIQLNIKYFDTITNSISDLWPNILRFSSRGLNNHWVCSDTIKFHGCIMMSVKITLSRYILKEITQSIFSKKKSIYFNLILSAAQIAVRISISETFNLIEPTLFSTGKSQSTIKDWLVCLIIHPILFIFLCFT